MSGKRVRRLGWAAVVVMLGSGLAVASSATAARATLSTTRLSGFSTARGSVWVGGQLQSALTVSPAAMRTVTVQYRRAGATSFTNATSSKTSSAGAITVTLKPPAAGTWQFRVAVAASATASGVVSGVRTVVAAGHASATSITGFATAAATVGVGHSLIDDVVIVPRAARLVYVQARRPGSAVFVTRTTTRASASGALRVGYAPTVPGTWLYRLVVPATATALQAVSPTRAITAKDITAPAPVTALTVSATTTSVSLAWTNPATPDFTGVLIRRATGPIPPASPSAGVLVANTAATTFTDGGLAATTEYSYAVFAHDGTPNYAPAAAVTTTTATALPTAAISISDYLSGPDTTKLTVNSIATFDAGQSHAGAGHTLTSATLDFGDGTVVRTFTGASSNWQAEHLYTSAGARNATLTVTDSAGWTSSSTQPITVFVAPSVTIAQTSGPAAASQVVTFAVTSSTPGGTAITDYDVSYDNAGSTAFGDGAPPATLTHTFSAPGQYTVIVDAYNDADGARRATIIVTVTP